MRPLRRVSCWAAVLLGLHAPVAAEEPSVYAPGCDGSIPAPQLSFTGSQTPGGLAAVHLTGGIPGAPVVLVVGLDDTLNVDLSFIQGMVPGCTLNTNDVIVIDFSLDAAGEVHLWFNQPTYLGDLLCFQFATLGNSNPFEVLMSEALRVPLYMKLTPSTTALDFGIQEGGMASAPQTVTLTNESAASFTLQNAVLSGAHGGDFDVTFLAGPLPLVIPAGGTTQFEVRFEPQGPGPRSAQLQLVHLQQFPLVGDPVVNLSGIGLGALGADILVDAGASVPYFDGLGQTWAADWGATSGTTATSSDPVTGTTEQALYQSRRQAAVLRYTFPVPNGTYAVTLHFVEPIATAPGARVFDVLAETLLFVDNLDLFVAAGHDVAHQRTFTVAVNDANLRIDLVASVGQSLVSALEVRRQFARLDVVPSASNFGGVTQGDDEALGLTLTNTGNVSLQLATIDFDTTAGTGAAFSLDLGGNGYAGVAGSVSHPASLSLAPSAFAPASAHFAPLTGGPHAVDLSFTGNFDVETVSLQGSGGGPNHPYLWAQAAPVPDAVDWNGTGVSVVLDGSDSVTYEPGHALASWVWTEGAATVARGETTAASFPVGPHNVCLTIGDDNAPPETDGTCVGFVIHSPTAVPGVSARYTQTGATPPAALLDAPPAETHYAETLSTFLVEEGAGTVGGSPFPSSVLVRLTGDLALGSAGSYELAASGGVDRRLLVDDALVTGPLTLAAGSHAIEARFAVDGLLDLPLSVSMGPEGQPLLPLDPGALTHDASTEPPVIHSTPAQGFPTGGESITVEGSGFFPAASVTVHWGGTDLTAANFTSIGPTAIGLLVPSGPPGPVSVTVETPGGVSNARTYLYGQLAATPDVGSLTFGATRLDETSAALTVVLSNETAGPVTITDAIVYDADATDFAALFQDPLPIDLDPGEETTLGVTFSPSMVGPRSAYLQVVHAHLLPEATDPVVPLAGIALGAPGEEILLDVGSASMYIDGTFHFWSSDYGATGGSSASWPDAITGTTEPALYQTTRSGPSFSYDLELPPGEYDVTLHFAEVEATAAGQRVLDVFAEGNLRVDDLDLFAVAGHDVAHVVTFLVSVTDGSLDLTFTGVTGDAILSALEARLKFARLSIQPTASHDFGQIEIGESADANFTLHNIGTATLQMSAIDILVVSGAGHDFKLDIAGTEYQGQEGDISLPATQQIAPGAFLPATLEYEVSEHGPQEVNFVVQGNFDAKVLQALGLGLIGSDPFLHVVIEPIATAVDYDQDGLQDILLDGSFSHTHEPGLELVSWEWTEGAAVLAATDVATVGFPVGPHSVCLEITDDDAPTSSLSDCASFEVVTPSDVPGVSASYFATGATPPASLLDSPPPVPNWHEFLPGYRIEGGGAGVGSSPLTTNVLVVLEGDVAIATGGPYVFSTLGGVDDRIRVDGAPYAGGSLNLSAGPHAVEARFALNTLADLPIELLMAPQGSPPASIATTLITHDETSDPPFLNSMPSEGTTLGGNAITISGTGFFPPAAVTVHWGATNLDVGDFTSLSSTQISFLSPPHSPGVIAVTVETPEGTSNSLPFTYTEAGLPPIVFTLQTISSFFPNLPTCGDWGPDGRYYVGTRTGKIVGIDVSENHTQTSKTIYNGVSALANKEILGLALNPFDPPSPVKLYVAHSLLYGQNGDPPSSPYPYTGQVSILTGPTFDSPVPYITGLPVSNHDHGINGMVFDNNGDLLICVGGNTNAGVPQIGLGLLPDSPFTGAILKAETSRAGFNGTITYVHSISGLPDADQMNGQDVDVADGVHVAVHAPGIRNPFDLALTTDGRLYATDNGPNAGLGNVSTGQTTQGGDASHGDELLYVEYEVYSGFANRNRGRYDGRQSIYRNTSVASIPGEFAQAIGLFSSSTDGIVEYRATTFQNQMRGNLLLQRWKGFLRRVVLGPDGRSVVLSEDLLPRTDSLGADIAPGGAILGLKYQGNQLDVLVPQDGAAAGVTAYDIFPWRAPATGGVSFVIGGANFGTLGNTSVSIGGLPATLTSVTSKRIKGTLPAQPTPTTELLDVVVTSGPEQSTIPDAFRYLFVPAGNEPGRWTIQGPSITSLGEVAGGILGGTLYLVGEGSPYTLTYDLVAGTWSNSSAAQRPHKGNHHAAEVWGGKLYLIGGFGDSSEGKVQIYDPQSNLWSLGAPMPWVGGSVCTALIGGKIYAAGGIVNNAFTTDQCAVYDPALDSWTPRASMPQGRNHASTGTDGTRLWVFGGRGPGSGDTNVVANGFANVQIYDPVANTWVSSNDPGSTLAPLPIGRGGTGKTVYYQGEFYVMGGETLNGPGATPQKVYTRVDVYDPATNTWRLEANMPTARHGIFPLLYQSRMFVAGGGTQSGNSKSTIVEVFTRQ